MNVSLHAVLKTTLSAAVLTLASGSAMAGLVTPKLTTTWVGADNILDFGTTIQNLAVNSSNSGYTGNPALTNDAWGHQGAWINFQVVSATDTKITLTSAATNAPAFTVYRTDGAFDGGSGSQDATNTTFQLGRPHNFNQVAQAGGLGIIWATDNSVTSALPGNNTVNGIVETLGYANASGNSYTNGYGAVIGAGAYDISSSNLYENGVTGSVSTGNASLELKSLASGWYTIFLGGSNIALAGAPINVAVSSVPVPGAVWLFGSALVGLMGASRRKLSA